MTILLSWWTIPGICAGMRPLTRNSRKDGRMTTLVVADLKKPLNLDKKIWDTPSPRSREPVKLQTKTHLLTTHKSSTNLFRAQIAAKTKRVTLLNLTFKILEKIPKTNASLTNKLTPKKLSNRLLWGLLLPKIASHKMERVLWLAVPNRCLASRASKLKDSGRNCGNEELAVF